MLARIHCVCVVWKKCLLLNWRFCGDKVQDVSHDGTLQLTGPVVLRLTSDDSVQLRGINMKYEGGLDDMASIYNKFSDVSNIFIFVAFWFQLVWFISTLFFDFFISLVSKVLFSSCIYLRNDNTNTFTSLLPLKVNGNLCCWLRWLDYL